MSPVAHSASHGGGLAPIPVLLPRLPSAEEILPLLKRIDERQIYSNYGPLWSAFKDALASYVGARATAQDLGAALTSSGTTAIELALRVRAIDGRRHCLMPAYTFIATAHAVSNAGFEPYLVDVDERSMALTPQLASAAIREMQSAPAAVVVVSPFGAAPDVRAWEQFEEEEGVPVVFDAAAAATSLTRAGRQPLCVSLHATKVFGIGEGGAVLSTDPELVERITAMTGFGFSGADRLSTMRGGNYRISEYAAAVGLAVVAGLDARLERLKALSLAYQTGLADADLRFQDGVGADWVTMTLNVVLPPDRLSAALERLDADGIQWRRWWGLGCHTHPAFRDAPRSSLQTTEALAPRVVGVPFFDTLSAEQIERVCRALR